MVLLSSYDLVPSCYKVHFPYRDASCVNLCARKPVALYICELGVRDLCFVALSKCLFKTKEASQSRNVFKKPAKPDCPYRIKLGITETWVKGNLHILNIYFDTLPFIGANLWKDIQQLVETRSWPRDYCDEDSSLCSPLVQQWCTALETLISSPIVLLKPWKSVFRKRDICAEKKAFCSRPKKYLYLVLRWDVYRKEKL